MHRPGVENICKVLHSLKIPRYSELSLGIISCIGFNIFQLEQKPNCCKLVTTGILLGRIIEGFSSIMTRENLVSHPASSHVELERSALLPETGPVPRFSWGEMQLEPDEEAELNQRMWLIQLRKLRNVIQKLSHAVGNPDRGTDGRNSASGMICQCIHMWLEQKATALQERCEVLNSAAGTDHNLVRQTSGSSAVHHSN